MSKELYEELKGPIDKPTLTSFLKSVKIYDHEMNFDLKIDALMRKFDKDNDGKLD